MGLWTETQRSEVEDQGAAEGPDVHAGGRTLTDQCGVGGTREPGWEGEG